MYSGIPNLASTFGYTNASWTLKADLTSEYVCRLLKHMDHKGYTECRPVMADPDMAPAPWVDFSSGYIQRGLSKFPQQGQARPWRVYQNYARDLVYFRYGKLEDGVMRFSKARGAGRRAEVGERARELESGLKETIRWTAVTAMRFRPPRRRPTGPSRRTGSTTRPRITAPG